MTLFRWGIASKRRMQGVNMDLVECATWVLENKSRYDMTIPWMGGVRTEEEQKELFLDAHSQLDGTVNKSYHQSGNALDIIPFNTDDITEAHYEFACFMLERWIDKGYSGKLQWGGNWKNSWDKPHYQVIY